jgi:hypothetical protein
MKRPQRVLLAAGIALIVAVNALVLAGVAWNRSGEPGSRLTLTQREAQLPYDFGHDGERGGAAVTLAWRVPATWHEADDGHAFNYSRGADWLDAARLRALGFDLSGDERTHRASREVLLVLELAGDAWQASIEHARRAHDALVARGTTNKAEENAVLSAQQSLQYEIDKASRLFAIDAGLDAAALRARYPDHARHAIVAATVRPLVRRDKEQLTISGQIEAVSVSSITVPHALRIAMADVDRNDVDTGRASFELDVAWGRRFEPWVSAVRVARDQASRRSSRSPVSSSTTKANGWRSSHVVIGSMCATSRHSPIDRGSRPKPGERKSWARCSIVRAATPSNGRITSSLGPGAATEAVLSSAAIIRGRRHAQHRPHQDVEG